MRNGLNLFLFLLLILQAVLIFELQRDTTVRNPMPVNDMVECPSFQSYEPNPNFADGRTLQAPPDGTIARGAQPLHFAATPEEALRAGQTLTNPFALEDAAAVQRGAEVYQTRCTACHGATGLGDGAVVKRGYPPPPSLLGEAARAKRDGQLFHALTYGQGNMPSHAAQLEPADRWKVILYIRSLQK